MIYTIDISGLITIDADSEDEAIEKVKNMFEEDELTVNDLWFSIESTLWK